MNLATSRVIDWGPNVGGSEEVPGFELIQDPRLVANDTSCLVLLYLNCLRKTLDSDNNIV